VKGNDGLLKEDQSATMRAHEDMNETPCDKSLRASLRGLHDAVYKATNGSCFAGFPMGLALVLIIDGKGAFTSFAVEWWWEMSKVLGRNSGDALEKRKREEPLTIPSSSEPWRKPLVALAQGD
jgi:hypothetical protein